MSIIVALDMTEERQVEDILIKLPQGIFLKVGMELFYSLGPNIVDKLKSRGYKIFLDLKLHDIPNTVRKALSALKPLSPDMITIHTAGGLKMLKSAAEIINDWDYPTKLLGVTQLTSTDKETLNIEIGIPGEIEDEVLRKAVMAFEAGLGGVIASPNEANLIKEKIPEFLIVCPGIRPKGSPADDQKRTATPEFARKNGANYIVVGRPITLAKDPAKAYEDIKKQWECN